ncbi:hypothetical protein [Oleispirillum naphthae]|uniref:hypothetical protein n=1 Tax=Oleispirillum naphthae TaxID=2838853 RepID=UPI0030824F33
MTKSPSRFRLGTEYDAFLFASVGEDKSGGMLSTLSALARMNLDPWREAAALAGLPADAAVRRLSALIVALPDPLSGTPDFPGIAARLVALLPRPTPVETPAAQTATAPEVPVRTMGLAFLLLMLLGVGTQWMMAHRQSSAQDQAARPSISDTGPRTPPPAFR